jgi:hypothetical protein
MSAQLLVSILAFIVSLASFSFAWVASVKAAKAEDVKSLLGEKETVAFGALKLLRDGLPGERETAPFGRLKLLRRRRKLRDEVRQRELVVGALVAASLFERSDRARALLFRVIEKYRSTDFSKDFNTQFAEFDRTIKSMDKYKFEHKEFNPGSAKVRLEAVRKVLEHKESAPPRQAT